MTDRIDNIVYKKSLFKYLYIFCLFSYVLFKILFALKWVENFKFVETIMIYISRFNYLIYVILIIRELYIFLSNKIKEPKKNKRYLITTLVSFVLVVFFYIFTRNTSYSTQLIRIYFAKELGIESFTKTTLYAKITGFIIWLFAYVSKAVNIFYGRGIAHSFGMYHYNNTGINIVTLIMCIWLVYGKDSKKNKLIFTLSVLAVCVLSWIYVNSRTSCIIMVLFVSLIWVKDIVKSFFRFSFKYSYILMFILSFVLAYVFIFIFPNYRSNFTVRFTEGVVALYYYGLNLFANNDPQMFNYFYFDNTYVRMTFECGLLFTICALFGLTYANKRMIDDRNIKFIIISICLCIYANMETLLDNELILFVVSYVYLTLEQSGLTLDDVKKEDVDSFYKLKCDKNNIYWTGWNDKPEYENIIEFVNRCVDNNKTKKDRKIYLGKVNSDVIGYIYIDYVDEETFHISPAIDSKYQGNGYGKELIGLAIEKGKELGFSKAEAYIREDNIASQKCFEYNGLHRTDTYEMKYIENMQKDVKMIRYFGEIK